MKLTTSKLFLQSLFIFCCILSVFAVEETETCQQVFNDNKKENYKDEVLSDLDIFFEKYKGLSQQAKMMSISSVLGAKVPDLFFVGFYVVKQKNDQIVSQDQQLNDQYLEENYILEVGPYISTILASPLIDYGKGVCGTAWKERKTQIVADVSLIQNYIACDLETQSEIVLPVFDQKNPEKVIAVLDIDSTLKNRFSLSDKLFFERVLTYLNYE